MKKILKTAELFCFLNLDYKIYTKIPTNQILKTTGTVKGGNQSAAIKNRTVLQTLSTLRGIIAVSNKLNCKLSLRFI